MYVYTLHSLYVKIGMKSKKDTPSRGSRAGYIEAATVAVRVKENDLLRVYVVCVSALIKQKKKKRKYIQE